MCTWFYADYKPLSNFIDKAQKLPLADKIGNAIQKEYKKRPIVSSRSFLYILSFIKISRSVFVVINSGLLNIRRRTLDQSHIH